MEERVFLDAYLKALSAAADDCDTCSLQLRELLNVSAALMFCDSQSLDQIKFTSNGVEYEYAGRQISRLFLSPCHAYYRRFISIVSTLFEQDRFEVLDVERFFTDGSVSYLTLPFLTGSISNTVHQHLLGRLFKNKTWLVEIIESLMLFYKALDESVNASMTETWSDLVSMIVQVPDKMCAAIQSTDDSAWWSFEKYFDNLAKQIMRCVAEFPNANLIMIAALIQKLLRRGNDEQILKRILNALIEIEAQNILAQKFQIIFHNLAPMEKEKMMYRLLDMASSTIPDVSTLSSLMQLILNVCNNDASTLAFISNLTIPTSRRNFASKPDAVICALIHTLHEQSRTDTKIFSKLFQNIFRVFSSPETTRMLPSNHLNLCKSLALSIGYIADSSSLPTNQQISLNPSQLFDMSQLFSTAQAHLGCGDNCVRECGLAIIDLFVLSFSSVQLSEKKNVIFGRKKDSESRILFELWEKAIEMRDKKCIAGEELWSQFRDTTLFQDSEEESDSESETETLVSTFRSKNFDPSLPLKKPGPKVFFLRDVLKLLQTLPENGEYREKIMHALKIIPELIDSLHKSSIVSTKEAAETAPELLRLLRNISIWKDDVQKLQLTACCDIIQLTPTNGGAIVISWVWQDLKNLSLGKTESWLVGNESRLGLEILARAANSLSNKSSVIETGSETIVATKSIELTDMRISKTRYFGSGPRKNLPVPRTNPYHAIFPKWYFALLDDVSLLYQRKWTDPTQLDFIRYFITILIRLIYAAGPFHVGICDAVEQMVRLLNWIGSNYLFDADASCDTGMLVHPILLSFRMILSFAKENSAGLVWKMTLFPTVLAENLDSDRWLQWLVERATCYGDDESHEASCIVQLIQEHRCQMLEL